MREIEETTIYDVDEFVREVVPPLGFQRHPIYRGQADSRWSVIPGLMREDLAKTEFPNWGEFEASLMWKFKQQTMGTIGSEPHSELEWISIAQDAGLPTRFTSWTEDALTALYFACQDSPGLADGDGAVYRILSGERKLVVSQDHEQIPEAAKVYNPRRATAEMRAQSTCFVSHPLPELDTPSVSFEDYFQCSDEPMHLAKIVIPAEAKRHMRQTMASLGTHAAKLFPGMPGVAAKIRDEVYSHTDAYDWVITG